MKNKKNQVQLVGRLGANPVVKMLESGSKVAHFSIAVVNPSRTKDGAKTSKVQWHMVTAWGVLAEQAEKSLHKGVLVTVDGKLNIRSYLNKAGIRSLKTEIIADKLFVAQEELSLTA